MPVYPAVECYSKCCGFSDSFQAVLFHCTKL